MDSKQCIHHWRIGRHDVGRCIKCGAEKDFGALLKKETRSPRLIAGSQGRKAKVGGKKDGA